LGFIVFPHKRRLKRRKGIHYQRKLHGLLHSYSQGEITLESVHASVQGWVNHVRYANTIGLRKAIFGDMIIHATGRFVNPFASDFRLNDWA
jgi:hypothetical protein